MSKDPACIFCKIIDGDIPCFKLYEDDDTLAFLDINPIAPGHALVVPKFHTPDVYAIPDQWIAITFQTAARVARAVEKAVEPDGLNLAQANGPGAKQSVMHFHAHVIPRFEGDNLTMNWELVPGDVDEMAALAERIQGNME
jgi:histidine triad (HIT) family protein